MAYGEFSGNPKAEWLTEGEADRMMRLLEDFWYTDPGGRRWDAPAGTETDGASIPKPLWSSVGSPFTGDYRRAAIVHDVACRDPHVPREEADKMFYYACQAGGCSTFQAKIMYAGVRMGAWTSAINFLGAADLSVRELGYRLPSEHSPDELEMRARYTLIARDLATTDDTFESVRAVVDKHLT